MTTRPIIDGMIKTRLLSIDAWKDCDGGWFWNNWYAIEDGIFLSEEIANSPRRLLAFCRRSGWLTEQSKGRLFIEDDGYNIVIHCRASGEPLLAFCYGEYQQD